MATVFEDIVEAVAAKLAVHPAVSPQIVQWDADPMPDSQASQVLVRLTTAQPQQMGGIAGNPVDWISELEITCTASTVRTDLRPTAIPAANALLLAVYARLAATPDLGLGFDAGVFIGEPAIEFATGQAATRIATSTLSYSVRHRTTSLTLE